MLYAALAAFPLLSFPAHVARAQTSQVPAAVDSAPNLPIKKIEPDDLIHLSVSQSPELTHTFRVAPDGSLALPMLDQPLSASGKYPSELAKTIASELKSENWFVTPLVSVTVTEYRSRPVTVMGAVRRPLSFQAEGHTTLLDALAKAEGLNGEAGPDIVVTSVRAEGGEGSEVRIPVSQLLNGSDPKLNLELHGGEQIRVPDARKIFVVGNVKHPGAFREESDGGSSVLKAIAQSEGLQSYTAQTAYIYRLDPASHTKQMIPVEIQDVMHRKSPDVPLQADDVLFVPEAHGRKVTIGALERVSAFAMATVSGVLIWH